MTQADLTFPASLLIVATLPAARRTNLRRSLDLDLSALKGLTRRPREAGQPRDLWRSWKMTLFKPSPFGQIERSWSGSKIFLLIIRPESDHCIVYPVSD